VAFGNETNETLKPRTTITLGIWFDEAKNRLLAVHASPVLKRLLLVHVTETPRGFLLSECRKC
jgi:hypothetical protein